MYGKLFGKKIIFMSGPDGAGKTTLALMLAEYYKNQGKRVVIRRIRGTHTFASLLARFLTKFNSFCGNMIPYFNLRIPSSMYRLWLFIEIISIVPHLVAYLIVYPLLGYYVILERSIVDFIVWLIFVLRKPKLIMNNIFINAMLKFTYRNIKSIYIKADINELVKRKIEEKYLIYSMSGIYDILSCYIPYQIDTTQKDKKTTYLEALNILDLI